MVETELLRNIPVSRTGEVAGINTCACNDEQAGTSKLFVERKYYFTVSKK